MKLLIMANGDYGDQDWYRSYLNSFDWVICADGGANWARIFGIIPNMVIGDMDSISKDERSYCEKGGASLRHFPAEKDFTDTYLALEVASQKGAGDVTIWGGTGSRLDHTLANIFSAARFTDCGMKIRFASPAATMYLVREDPLLLKGQAGDTVSVLALGERAVGVSLAGFKYPVDGGVLEADKPIGVSNIMMGEESLIQATSGILAVFHHHAPT
jgi:thiamine pyrophosphokinase